MSICFIDGSVDFRDGTTTVCEGVLRTRGVQQQVHVGAADQVGIFTMGSSCSGCLTFRLFRWMAPESFFDGTWDLKSDVWMFGVLLWGLFAYSC